MLLDLDSNFWEFIKILCQQIGFLCLITSLMVTTIFAFKHPENDNTDRRGLQCIFGLYAFSLLLIVAHKYFAILFICGFLAVGPYIVLRGIFRSFIIAFLPYTKYRRCFFGD